MAISRVQGRATNSPSTVTSLAGTLLAGVTQGNLLVVAVATGGNDTTFSGPSGWTQATVNIPLGSATISTSIWYRIVDAGAAGQTSWTWTIGVSHTMYICIEEWSATNSWLASPIDRTANGNTSGSPTTSTTIRSGTTSTTTQAEELWVASLAYKNSAQTENSITAGWTRDLEATLAANNTMTMLYDVVSSTSAAACQYTIGSAQHWAGCVATFKPVTIVTSDRTIPASAALLSTNSRTVGSTAALQSTNERSASSSAALLQTLDRTIPSSAAIADTFSRDIPSTVALNQPVSKDIPATAALSGTFSRIALATAALQSTDNTRTVPTSAAILETKSRAVPSDTALANTDSRTIPSSAALTGTESRTVPATTALTNAISLAIPATVALTSTPSRTIAATAALSIEIASGGFALFASGTGVASFSNYRVTEYPDPALSLAPVLPRLGSSSASWNAVTPAGTTAVVSTSIDAVNWDTATSGEEIDGLDTQPDPIIDTFVLDSSANYTSTYKSGGSTASISYDTANSRISLVGGSSALYLNSSIVDDDIDLICDMDRSDAGGLVWHFVDSSNYYELGCYDDSSSGGFTNQLRLYKVASGTRTLLGSASDITWHRSTVDTSPYKRIRVTMTEATIQVYFDGELKQEYVDGSPLAAGKVGLRNDGGTSRFYQLRIQQLGDYVSGTPESDIVTAQYVYTKVELETTDPSVTPQIADLTTSARSPKLATGALIENLQDPSAPFAALYNAEMDSLAEQSGDYFWNVDSESELTFLERMGTPAPRCLHSTDFLFTPNVQPTSAADLYRSQVIITNTIGITEQTEQKVADGTATSWNMAYPLYSAPVITVQGVEKTIGIQGVDSGKDFYWQAASNSIGQDENAEPLPAGYVITFTYVGQFPDQVTRNNVPEQLIRKDAEGGSGIVCYIEDGKQMLSTKAIGYADGLLARHNRNDTVSLTATTELDGFKSGMVAPFFVQEHSLVNRQLLIVKVTAIPYQRHDESIVYQYTLEATDGANENNWSKAIL